MVDVMVVMLAVVLDNCTPSRFITVCGSFVYAIVYRYLFHADAEVA
jgi:hypothetical protein